MVFGFSLLFSRSRPGLASKSFSSDPLHPWRASVQFCAHPRRRAKANATWMSACEFTARVPATENRPSRCFLVCLSLSVCPPGESKRVITIERPVWIQPCAPRKATTLMVHNIPAECGLDLILAAWPIDGSYDFLYLPMGTGGRLAVGWAFVNFVSVAHAEASGARRGAPGRAEPCDGRQQLRWAFRIQDP